MFLVRDVERFEREVITVLKFNLILDTLYFWLDLAVKLWDLFIENEGSYLGYRVYKPVSAQKFSIRYEPPNNEFQLGKPNRYRDIVQALDLMSLHFEVHLYTRPSIVLAVLAVIHLRDSQLLELNPCSNIPQLQDEIKLWANNQIDGPDDVFEAFRKFLEMYCQEMLPENFDTRIWAKKLLDEMCFAS